jgi:GNAT superfamily N-acetyltransferase
MHVVHVGDGATATSARRLLAEYLSWVAAVASTEHGLTFDAAAMLAADLDEGARFHLLCRDGEPVGIGGLKRLGPTHAEIQRLYVQPQSRGLGGGRQLLARLLDAARADGIEHLRLESLRSLSAAHALYRAAGFVEVPPHDGAAPGAYRDNVVFTALDLRR